MGKVVNRIVEEAVPQTGSHQRSYKQRKKKGIQCLHRYTLTLIERAHYVIAHRKEARDEKHAVPPQVEISDSEYVRTDIPSNSKKIQHKKILVR